MSLSCVFFHDEKQHKNYVQLQGLSTRLKHFLKENLDCIGHAREQIIFFDDTQEKKHSLMLYLFDDPHQSLSERREHLDAIAKAIYKLRRYQEVSSPAFFEERPLSLADIHSTPDFSTADFQNDVLALYNEVNEASRAFKQETYPLFSKRF